MVVRQQFEVSERRACRLLFQRRATRRYLLTPRNDKDSPTQAIIALASEYSRYDYRRIATLLENGYHESFNNKPRDELLNGEIFYSLSEHRC